MMLELEVPVLRGFLTAGEAATWKQSTEATAGKDLLVIYFFFKKVLSVLFFFRIAICRTNRSRYLGRCCFSRCFLTLKLSG